MNLLQGNKTGKGGGGGGTGIEKEIVVKFNSNSKNFLHPTRGNFIVVSAGL